MHEFVRVCVPIGPCRRGARRRWRPPPPIAQTDFPRRAVKFVVPVPPGNMLDSMPRIIGEKLSPRWSQPVIVENRPGAASNLGAEAVFKSEPDGYTLLVTPPGPLVGQPARLSEARLRPDGVRAGFDADPVSVHPGGQRKGAGHDAWRTSSPAPRRTRARSPSARPGVSSTPHLQMERFAAAAGIKFVHVPYPGLAPAMRDLLAGHIDAIFDTPGQRAAACRQRRREGAGGDRRERIPELPNVPAIAETLPGIVHTDWFAVVAPPKTPPEIATRLSQAIAETMKQPDVAKRIADFSVTAVGGTPAETGALMKREAEHYRGLIASAGIKIEK